MGSAGRLNVLMASAEVAPFSKVGGLGDVVGALPKELLKAKVNVQVITPLYGFIDRIKYKLRKVSKLEDMEIEVGNETYCVRILRSKIPESKVQIFFVECDDLFSRDGVYRDPDNGHGYDDNPVRFILFSKAVVEFLKTGIVEPNIIHLNDNQTALIAPMLKTVDENRKYESVPIVLSIHNAQYQGNYHESFIHHAGLDWSLAYPGGPFEFYGNFNSLKAGILYADKITTVSPTYAMETMMSAEYAFGLEGVLKSRQDDYLGIVNGADYSIWDPKHDKFIPANFTTRSLKKKQLNKEELLERAGLHNADSAKPVLGIVSRLVYQKGIDLIISVLPEILSSEAYVVLLGEGDEFYQQQLSELKEQYPDKLGLFLTFSNELAHWIYAGSDMLLMPSRFEPCGLNQLYALRYGTIPVVRKTGGLADTIKEFDPETGEGWGFGFSGYSSDEFAGAIWRAVGLYQDKKEWQKLMRRGMKQDYSWQTSAEMYKKLYLEMSVNEQ